MTVYRVTATLYNAVIVREFFSMTEAILWQFGMEKDGWTVSAPVVSSAGERVAC